VLEVAEDIVVKEAAMAKALMTGASIAAVMGGAYEHMLKS
jgi:4-hydroxy-4-methyl-2-oxoglutarate aldolase